MNSLKPERMQWSAIREAAENFRQKYVNPPDKIPVPIVEIVEFDLEITPRPINGLLQEIDIDGFLSNDFKYMFIDNDIYMDERRENRLRFTLAHEVGHLVLHKDIIQQCEFRNEADWINFREDMSEDDLFWFEQQAYEFAGRLLVPKRHLIQELEKNKDKIAQYYELVEHANDDQLYQAIARIICGKFGVSDSVIMKRIRNEKIWEQLDL